MMLQRTLALAIVVVLVGVSAASAATKGAPREPSLHDLARLAVSQDTAQAASAIARLRAEGPAGLDALLELHRSATADEVARPLDEQFAARFAAAVDAVAAQRDALEAGLYWYTDLDAAVAAARSAGKPILSLRLLGNLSDEYSCANSRFFRTVLYPHGQIGPFLRENFVLHWQSVRPVPRITIDFGDGRRIERTITGNSVHHVLDSRGRPVDAIPGLYGPAAFLRAAAAARDAAVAAGRLDGADRDAFLARYHADRLAAVSRAWVNDLERVGVPVESLRVPRPVNGVAPPAAEAAMVVASKSAAEVPMLRALTPAELAAAERASDQAVWERVAALHAGDAALDARARAMMARKQAGQDRGVLLLGGKAEVENPMRRLVEAFERSIALDTVRNEYLLHRRIHGWFAEDSAGIAQAGLDSFNERIYAELFLTPSSDPWLGLAPEDAYTALDGAGLVVAE